MTQRTLEDAILSTPDLQSRLQALKGGSSLEDHESDASQSPPVSRPATENISPPAPQNEPASQNLLHSAGEPSRQQKTLRLVAAHAKLLPQVAAFNKLFGQAPQTEQAIVDEALRDWFDRHNFPEKFPDGI